MTTDDQPDDHQPDDHHPNDDHPNDQQPARPTFDDVARDAGASFRRAAPDGSIERVVIAGRRRQRRQLAVAVTAGAVLIGGVVLVGARGGDDDTVTKTVDEGPATSAPDGGGAPASAAATSTSAPTSTATPTTVASTTTLALSAETSWALEYTGGTPGVAEGEPVRIGFASWGSPEISTGAVEAAAAFVNAELGGVAGRPVELDVCYLGSGEGGAGCGARFAADDSIVGVIIPVDSQDFLDALAGTRPGIASMLTAQVGQISYVPSFDDNFIAAAKVVQSEVPPGGMIVALGGLAAALPLLDQYDVTELAGPAGTADEIVVQLETAGVTDPDAVTVWGDLACAPIREALDQLGSDAIIISATCNDRVENTFHIDVPLNPDDPSLESGAQMALAKSAQYGYEPADATLSPRDPVFRFTLEQFGDLLTMVKALNTVDGDFARERVREALVDLTGPAIFTGQQACERTAQSGTVVHSCATTANVLQVRGGKFVTLDPIDVTLP